jgi:hypothetical protein
LRFALARFAPLRVSGERPVDEVLPTEVRSGEVRPAEVRYFRVLLSPLIPCGYSLLEDLQMFFVRHRLSVILPLWR